MAASVAAAPAAAAARPTSLSYADFPEGILPLDFSVQARAVSVEARSGSLQKRDCPGGNYNVCIPVMGNVCIFTCGLRYNFDCLVGCPVQAHEDCMSWCT